MHDGTPSQALEILVVTEDRALSRRLSQFLQTVGYQVRQAAEFPLAVSAIESGDAEIVLVDESLASRENWELCRMSHERPSAGGRFLFLMIDEASAGQIADALEAGVDDVLLMPIEFGELQSRLRAAARVLEHDRRSRLQSRVDAVTGLPTRSAFAARVRATPAGAAAKGACVVADLDFYRRVGRLHGQTAASALLKAVARELQNLCAESDMLGCLGGDRFCAMVFGANEATAAEWAERAGELLASTSFHLDGADCRVTASFGVSSRGTADHVEQLIDQATQALQTAKSMGRNCVVRFGEGADQTREVRTFGKLFERTSARDVMTPCTLFLLGTEPLSHADELLAHARVDGIPVVDAAGKYLGLCTAEQLSGAPDSKRGTAVVRDVMAVDVRTFAMDEDFGTLMEYFTQDPLSLAVVVDEGRPLGMLNCDCLLALSQPVRPGSTLPQPEYCDTSEFLLVTDGCGKDCESTS